MKEQRITLLLGMALQAMISASLSLMGLISLSVGQQFLAGFIFMVIAASLMVFDRK